MAAYVHEHAEAGAHAGHGRPGKRRFAVHFVEMNAAMFVGMGIGGALGIAHVVSTELCAALWLLSMIAPMTLWMSIRGMPIRTSAEMSAAMAVPVVAALPLFWLGSIQRGTLIGIEHMAMLPAMLALMAYRRQAYGWPRP